MHVWSPEYMAFSRPDIPPRHQLHVLLALYLQLFDSKRTVGEPDCCASLLKGRAECHLAAVASHYYPKCAPVKAMLRKIVLTVAHTRPLFIYLTGHSTDT